MLLQQQQIRGALDLKTQITIEKNGFQALTEIRQRKLKSEVRFSQVRKQLTSERWAGNSKTSTLGSRSSS